VTLLLRSPLYETPALGPPQPDYLNAAARIAWPGSLESLFAVTQHVELLLGRERKTRWGARTIDIDILDWSEGAVNTPTLVVPHAELLNRNFALAPLLDVMPERAARFAETLERLGGAPPRAAPDWLSLDLRQVGETESLRAQVDEAELICLAVGAVSACTSAGATARSTLPFSVPSGPSNTPDASALMARVAAAHHHGFRVHCAAITQFGSTGTHGFLAGEHTGKAEPAAWAELALSRVEGGTTGLRVSMAKPL
jgi:2-amino-4-hydroxy-6-hydroxymethyldihydropteridine diphosphokinase